MKPYRRLIGLAAIVMIPVVMHIASMIVHVQKVVERDFIRVMYSFDSRCVNNELYYYIRGTTGQRMRGAYLFTQDRVSLYLEPGQWWWDSVVGKRVRIVCKFSTTDDDQWVRITGPFKNMVYGPWPLGTQEELFRFLDDLYANQQTWRQRLSHRVAETPSKPD